MIVAILFEVTSYFWKKEVFSLTSLILLMLGTIGAFIALQTGEAAETTAKAISGIRSLLHEHEESAGLVFYLYLGITIIKSILMHLKKDVLPWRIIVLTGFIAGTFVLYRIAHCGGQLVYEWGAGVKPVLEQYKEKPVTD